MPNPNPITAEELAELGVMVVRLRARIAELEAERDNAVRYSDLVIAERDALVANQAVRADKEDVASELAEAIKQCQRQNRQMAICEELITKYAPDLEDKEYPDGVYCYGYQMAELVPRLIAERDAAIQRAERAEACATRAKLQEAEGDSARLNRLEEHAQPTMVDGEPKALAVVICYHLENSLREAIDAIYPPAGGEGERCPPLAS